MDSASSLLGLHPDVEQLGKTMVGDDREWGGGRGGEAYDRSYKLSRNSEYLTPARLDADINHTQVLRCVLSVLWPSASLIHFLLLFFFSAPEMCMAEPRWFMTYPGSFIWWHEMHRQPFHMKFLSSSTFWVNCHACAHSSDGNVIDEELTSVNKTVLNLNT